MSARVFDFHATTHLRFLPCYVLPHNKAPLLSLAPMPIFSCILLHAHFSFCAGDKPAGVFANGSSVWLRVSPHAGLESCLVVRKFSQSHGREQIRPRTGRS